MTYANAKKIFINETHPFNTSLLEDIIKNRCELHKLIITVGKDASSVSAFLASILKSSEISTTVCDDHFAFEVYEMFKSNGKYISPERLCKYVEYIKQNSLSIPDKNTCALITSLLFASDEKSEFLIFNCSDISYYKDVISNIIPSSALIIFSNKDEEDLIEILPKRTEKCVYFTRSDNFDYISNTFSKDGTHLYPVSENKLLMAKTTLMGSEFYYNRELFRSNAYSKDEIFSACIAIESARALSLSRTDILYGISHTRLTFALNIHSLSPIIGVKSTRADENRENIIAYINLLKNIVRTDIKIFASDDILSDISDYKFDDSMYLRKNISTFINANKNTPLLFIGSLETISKIKKELEHIK